MSVSISHPTDRPNFTFVQVGNLDLWFSYRTIVAFRDGYGKTTKVSENAWGNTTGRHLNYIDDGNKSTRLSRDDFTASLAVVMSLHGL